MDTGGNTDGPIISGKAFLWFGIAVFVTLITVLSLEEIDKKEPENGISPSVIASLVDESGKGTQQGIQLPQNCAIPGKIPYGCLDTLSTEERDAFTCPNEDGTNVKGQPCIWMDPDTRDLYYVISD